MPSACALVSTSVSIQSGQLLLVCAWALARDLLALFARLGLDLRTGLYFMDRAHPLYDEFLRKVAGDVAVAKAA